MRCQAAAAATSPVASWVAWVGAGEGEGAAEAAWVKAAEGEAAAEVAWGGGCATGRSAR